MSSTSSRYQPFLNIHVVWHPGLGDAGKTLAESWYRQFGRDPDRPMSPAIGVPVYFHTAARKGMLPPQIDLDRARHSVVMLLVNSSMVIDPLWVAFATTLNDQAIASNRRHLVLQVTLFPEQGDLELGTTQSVRFQRPPKDDAERDVMLRLKLAAEVCRLLQGRPRGGGAENRLSYEPTQLFISHAKRDAEDKAEAVLKKVVEETQLDTFFDKADIAPGADFTEEIRESIKRSVVLAWQSDEYASRPWCNIELLTAKEHLRPIVAVLGVKQGEERSFPYLGNVRTIVSTGDNTLEIIASAVREYLRKLYVEGRFKMLADAGEVPATRFHLFRPPEPIDGALLQREKRASTAASASASGPEAGHSDGPELVLYPDPPLGNAESEAIARLFPAIRFATPSTVDGSSLNGLTVGLSISEADDLAEHGASALHLVSAMVEISRHILSRRAIIAYGGDLRERAVNGYTRQLFELVRAYKDLGREPLQRILNFLAFHVAADLPEAEEARLLRVATFVKTPLPADLAARLGIAATIPDDTAEHRYVRARALTAMREEMVERIDARVVLGGRVNGHQGKYPGILEEAYLTLRAAKPLFLVGGFGGCARLLAKAVHTRQQPEEFTRSYQVQHPRARTFKNADGSAGEEVVPFEQLEAQYAADGPDPIDYDGAVGAFTTAKVLDLRNGLSDEENIELFETPDLDRIVLLVMKGLGRIAAER